jgi:hypothetical protein
VPDRFDLQALLAEVADVTEHVVQRVPVDQHGSGLQDADVHQRAVGAFRWREQPVAAVALRWRLLVKQRFGVLALDG